jgi:allantoin racemase
VENRTTRRIAVLGTGDGGNVDVLPEPITARAMDGVQPQLLAVPDAVFPATPTHRQLAAQAYVRAGLAAAQAGFDAIFINTVGDYGLADLRRRTAIPVVGAGEAALREACRGGRQFSIVTVWPPSMDFIYEYILRDTGLLAHCNSRHFLSEDQHLENLTEAGNPIRDFLNCAYLPMEAVKRLCRSVLADHGSDVLVLGCTCMAGMAPVLAAAGLPVIEPMRCGYASAVQAACQRHIEAR